MDKEYFEGHKKLFIEGAQMLLRATIGFRDSPLTIDALPSAAQQLVVAKALTPPYYCCAPQKPKLNSSCAQSDTRTSVLTHKQIL